MLNFFREKCLLLCDIPILFISDLGIHFIHCKQKWNIACYLGLTLNVFCVAFMTILVFHPVMAEDMLLKGIDRGAYASDEKERSAQAEAERFHGGLPRDGGLPERAQKSFISCDRSHISSENRAVFSWFTASGSHFLFGRSFTISFDVIHAGGDLGGNAAAAGGNGHQ